MSPAEMQARIAALEVSHGEMAMAMAKHSLAARESHESEMRALAEVAAVEARFAGLRAENEAARRSLGKAEAACDAMQARLADMIAAARQARDDEEWALKNQIEVKALEHGKWKLTWWCDKVLAHSFGDSFHAALRALRAKIEGGAR